MSRIKWKHLTIYNTEINPYYKLLAYLLTKVIIQVHKGSANIYIPSNNNLCSQVFTHCKPGNIKNVAHEKSHKKTCNINVIILQIISVLCEIAGLESCCSFSFLDREAFKDALLSR